MTLANKITIARMGMVPVFLAVMLTPFPYYRLWAALIFLVAALTDILDGYVARRNHHVSDFGKVFDPIADKIIVLAALVPMVAWGVMPALAAIVIIGRELLVSGLRIAAVSRGGHVISASWLGKVKTVSQDAAVVLILVRGDILDRFTAFPIETAALYAALVFTVWSAADYFIRNRSAFAGR